MNWKMRRILNFALLFAGYTWTSASSGQIIFEDGFESGDLSARSGAARWSEVGFSVDSADSRSGRYSAVATYGPDPDGEDSWKELIFNLGQELDEVWIEYWVLFPDNYFHRDSSGPDNNKFFQLNRDGGGSGLNMLTIESDREGVNGHSRMRRFLSETQHPNGSNNWPTDDDGTANFIGDGPQYAIELGKWTKVQVYYRAGTDGVRNDGRAEIRINDQLFHALDWPFWQPGSGGAVDGGYIMGWSNSGFSDATSIRIDDFKAYGSDPGWSSPPSAPELSVR